VASQINHIQDEIFVVENLIPKSFQEAVIHRLQGSEHFPWFAIHRVGAPSYFPRGTNPNYVDQRITDDVGFFHMVHDGEKISPYYDLFRGILEFYAEKFDKEIVEILRIRLRYTHTSVGHDETKYAAPHIDFPSTNGYTTLLYYIDDSDGDTILFDKLFNPAVEKFDPIVKDPLTEVFRYAPKKGNALIFNGHRYHSGNYPIKNSARIVANFDFIEKDL
jgi:hypothetical protein